MVRDFDIGVLAFNVPGDCPDPVKFEAVFRGIFNRHFTDDNFAVDCRNERRRALVVPKPFSDNTDASYYYQRAALALSSSAQIWVAFEEEVNREFADIEDDGERKDPAIPGWSPDWISLD